MNISPIWHRTTSYELSASGSEAASLTCHSIWEPAGAAVDFATLDHVGRDIDCGHRSVGPDLLGCEPGDDAGAARDIQNSVAGM